MVCQQKKRSHMNIKIRNFVFARSYVETSSRNFLNNILKSKRHIHSFRRKAGKKDCILFHGSWY
uniref:Uncharacterized protein n=1 Tax=Kuenenia stuttgartiensis TaxID=174633 RepID=Q1Q4X5_KUEST|nr:unknown protein [Candidatus Kuenenia stuttgartiensis]